LSNRTRPPESFFIVLPYFSFLFLGNPIADGLRGPVTLRNLFVGPRNPVADGLRGPVTLRNPFVGGLPLFLPYVPGPVGIYLLLFNFNTHRHTPTSIGMSMYSFLLGMVT
jgi:hypothetical protein